MSDNFKVGGEVDAYCTTCKVMKWHVIVAVVGGKPAKVECNGCHKQHGYRPHLPGEAKPKVASTKTKAVRTRSAKGSGPPPIQDLEEKLRVRASEARSYSPKDTFAVNDIVRHPQFGAGLVVGLPAAQRMEVAFPDGRKVLVHQRGEGGAPALTLARPARRDDDLKWVSDAPPPPAKDSSEG
jgi:hypothetical protein